MEKRTERLVIMLTENEKAEIEKVAKKNLQSSSNYGRIQMLKGVKNENNRKTIVSKRKK